MRRVHARLKARAFAETVLEIDLIRVSYGLVLAQLCSLLGNTARLNEQNEVSWVEFIKGFDQ